VQLFAFSISPGAARRRSVAKTNLVGISVRDELLTLMPSNSQQRNQFPLVV
jgi:hypothetical protein